MDNEEYQTEDKQQSENPFEDRVIKVIKDYLGGEGFSHRMIIDLPKETNSVIPRKYVTLNGTTANRPTASVTGQRYFDTTIGRPVYWNGSTFVDGAGSIS